MADEKTTIANEAPRIGGFQVQTSVYGRPETLLWGTTRVSGNLIYYSDFKATPHTNTSQSGGKGDTVIVQSDTTYTYNATVMIAICQGPIGSVGRLWQDKERTVLLFGEPFTLFLGALGQATWAFLTTNHPTEAVGYSGVAYVAKSNYLLSSQATLSQFSFEVRSNFIAAGRDDAEPSTVVTDILTNLRYGVGWDAANIAPLTTYSTYCRAADIYISPALQEQVEAQAFLEDIALATNSEWVPSDGQIKLVPYGDKAITGPAITGSVVYTPNMTPLYNLTDDDYLVQDGAPVICERRTQVDAFNHVQVEFRNRANDYNVDIAEAKDSANIERYGIRSKSIVKLHMLCEKDMASKVAQSILKRELYSRNLYRAKLGIRYSLLEPMDLVSLDDLGLGMADELVRVVSIEENDADEFDFVFEEVPIGVHTPPLYQLQDALGYTPNFNSPAGNADSPVIFEPPIDLAPDLLEICIAITGTTTDWGGCHVWLSLDGTNYKNMGRVNGGARYGSLAVSLPAAAAGVDTVNTLAVTLDGLGGQLLSGAAVDMQNFATLMYVDGEYLAYQTATLVTTNRYNLTTLNRGAYDTPTGAHASGAPWARLDDAIFHIPLELNYIGKQLYFKFTSFNIYGGAAQSTADVSPYNYTVTGNFVNLPPPVVDTFLFSQQADGTRQFTWSWTTTTLPKDLLGYKMRFFIGATANWDLMTDMHVGFLSQSPFESNQLGGGSYTFAIKTVDKLGNLSATARFVSATLGDPRLGGVLLGVFPNEIGWPGTLTSCFRDGTVLSADGDPWSSRTAWSTWSSWNLVAKSPIQYDHTTIDVGASVPFTPLIQATGIGTVVVTIATSIDNVSYTGYAAPSPIPITARYIKVRVVSTGTNPKIETLSILIDGNEKTDHREDLLTSSLTGANRIGVGDIRLPLTKTYVAIQRINLAIQGVGGGFTWKIIDKAVANGPRIQIYNAANALADATIDYEIIGV